MGNFFSLNKGKTAIFFFVVFCVFYLPFINKAFHIDDVDFIHFSEMIGWNPLNSTPIDYPYNGQVLKGYLPAYEMTHPLVVPYVIKIVSALFSQNEVVLHLSFFFFSLLSLISIFLLSRVLFPDSKNLGVLAALFLCSTPAFLVNSHKIMSDVPTLSCLLLSMASYSLYAERGSKGLAYLGGIALSLATFTSYQALFFVPVIFLYILLRKRLNIHSILSLAIPVVALLIWFLLLYSTHGLFPLLKSRGESERSLISFLINMGLQYRVLIGKAISILAFIGSSMLFLVPAYLFLNRSGLKFFVIFLPLAALSYLAVSAGTGYPFSDNAFLALMVALGLLSLLIALKESLMTGDEHNLKARGIFLSSWIFLVAIYIMVFFPWVSARYVLPALPPLIMIILNGLGWERSNKRKIIISCALFLSVLFGLASGYSDYKFADSYREFGRDVKELRSGNDVWYIGAWGMLYYMDKAGARYLFATSDEPKKGDFVVIPQMAGFWVPSPQLQMRLGPYAQKIVKSPLPLRLYNGRSHAGFYSNVGCLLPFAFSEEPDEFFWVFRVIR